MARLRPNRPGRDARIVTREMRRLYKQIDDLDRRMASMVLAGPVAAIDGDRIRIELLPQDSRTGKPFLSPWVQVQEAASADGASATHFPVKIGDPMRLFSPNGELGSFSFAVRDSYTSSAANPTDKKQQALVIRHGGCSMVFDGDEIKLLSGKVTHNGANIGDTHIHDGVERGGAVTNPPAN
jgi:hypothetical protein